MFYLFLIAQGFSLTGGYVQTLVLSWLAADLAGGLYALSCYMLACYLPVAILSYPIARWLDGRAQKGWLIGSELSLAALSFLLWQAAARDWISFPFLLIFGGVWGCIRAIQTPIYQSLPRRLSQNLARGTALLTVLTYAARGVGPILGGLLFSAYGASVPFLVNFCSFLPSVALLCFLKIPRTEKGEKPRIKKRLPTLLRIFAVGFFAVNYNVTFVALVKESGLGSGSYGLALGLLGAGALLGFWLKAADRRIPSARAVAGMGILNLVLAFTRNLWLAGGCILLYGVLDFWFFSDAVFRLSRSAEQREINAVMGLYTIVTVGAMPLGALFWSFISRSLSLTVALLLIGTALFLLRNKISLTS